MGFTKPLPAERVSKTRTGRQAASGTHKKKVFRWGPEILVLTVGATVCVSLQPGCSESPNVPASQPWVETHEPQGIPSAPAVFVAMTDKNTFKPVAVTIRLGQTVMWRNVSKTAQTITADPTVATNAANVALPPYANPFNSGTIKPGDTWEYTFRVPGRYRYFSINHEQQGMVGQILVESKPAK